MRTKCAKTKVIPSQNSGKKVNDCSNLNICYKVIGVKYILIEDGHNEMEKNIFYI